ncbi:hypothetical protein CPB83DRAFT_895409 [Crepidotus variabilis]|uniref:Uncharacterized protein n=1 Tax=Crepidotus variabilis TaxID=179855 RepID=A0A9P6EDL8_9AGAR|nr:hypothetical protein CPB83DRAFT_895409 [Crepidotus variabilis]
MSVVVKKGISTSFAFSRLPPVDEWGLNNVIHAPHSAGAHSRTSTEYKITAGDINNLLEDLLAKSNVEKHLRKLRIVHDWFNLDSSSNQTNIERTLYVLLDKYALYVVTGSRKTLESLIELFERDNEKQQQCYDRVQPTSRTIGISDPPVSNAEYELVVLYPEHLLPLGTEFTIYTPTTSASPAISLSSKHYVAASDGTLRESPGTEASPRLAPSPSMAIEMAYLLQTHFL